MGDRLLLDAAGNLYLFSPEESAINRFDASHTRHRVVIDNPLV